MSKRGHALIIEKVYISEFERFAILYKDFYFYIRIYRSPGT